MATPEPEEPQRLPDNAAAFLFSLGFEGNRRHNLCYIADTVLLHSCGNIVHLWDIQKNSTTYLPCVEGCGIGAVTVHPSRQWFAVCEKGSNPSIYIYEYPMLTSSKILRDGTERLYTAAAFNHDGTQLATVGGFPDYWLTVWDWSNETIILRAKAFSQDVFTVSFSKFFSGQLLTSGVGHIRFWKMAYTFTGLKLEGFIGKFGQVTISDIAGYVELSNGKVISGTESGGIIVWEGELVKCQLKRQGGKPCHDGMIELVILDEEANQLITAGADGYIKFWSFGEWLDAADDGDEKLICEVDPLRELQVGSDCRIKGIIFEADHWVIQDEAGAIWRVNIPSFELEKLMEFHSGSIIAAASSPNNYYIASAGSDGTVRLYNFSQQSQVYMRQFSSGATALTWFPLAVDAQGKTVAVGFTDGVVRVLQQCRSKWALLHVMKPHTMDVAALRASPDGEILATGSKDATVFFFHIVDSYRPIGFVKTTGPVKCLDWSPTSMHVLLGCSNGDILEVVRPDLNTDTRFTFKLKLPIKSFRFLLPKIKRPRRKSSSPKQASNTKEEEKEKNIVVESEKDSSAEPQVESNSEQTNDPLEDMDNPQEELSIGAELSIGEARPAEGSESSPQEADADALVEPEVTTRKKSSVVVPEEDHYSSEFPVRAVMYTNGVMNTFYVALEGKAAGLLYECHIDTPEVLGYSKWSPGSLSCLTYSHSCQYVVSGSDNGLVHIHTAPLPGQLSLMQQQKYWEGTLHDSFVGIVGGAVLSYDDRYLASVAHDGSFVINKLDEAILAPAYKETAIETGVLACNFELERCQMQMAELEDKADAEDVGLNVYSIEEDKQKTEEESKLRLAMQKKSLVKERIENIRMTLTGLLRENAQLSSSEQLPIEDFEIDASLRSIIEKEIQQNIEDARKEMLWESEKKSIALSKLQAFFLDNLEVEHIVLHSFQSGTHVWSFRTEKLLPEFQAIVASANETESSNPLFSVHNPLANLIEGRVRWTTFQLPEEAPLDQAILEDRHLTKQDIRRIQMKQRDAAYLEYVNAKPDENHVNKDVSAGIQWAETTKGDFKLKTDPHYVIPEELRTNATKKKTEIVILLCSIHSKKMEFNKKFLEMRDKKRKIKKMIQDMNKRIADINRILKIKGETLFMPETFKDESPEDRGIVSPKDIDEFKEKLRASEEKVKENKAGGFGGFGGMTKNVDKEKEKEKEKVDDSKAKTVQSKEPAEKPTEESGLPVILRTFPASPLEKAELEALHIRVKLEKQRLLQKFYSLTNKFDNDLEELRHERFLYEINFKGAEMRTLVLYQELRLLQGLQPQEAALEGRLTSKLQEDADLQLKLLDQDKLLEQKRQEIGVLNEQKHQLLLEFESLMGEENPFRDALLKTYQRKIKRIKDTGEEDEEEEISDVEDEGDDEEEEEEIVEVCPNGCDEALYQSVCSLRERRLDVDEVFSINVKQLDALQKEKESKLKKRKALENAMLAIKKDMEVFQREKQTALNQIDVALRLYMHQIEYFIDGALPNDLSGGLVFSDATLKSLKLTIEKHVEQKTALRRLLRDLHKHHKNLHHERKEREAKVAELEERIVDVQRLRFGQVIDLDVVDTLRVKKDTIELKERVRDQEISYAHEVAEWNHKLAVATDELANAMKQNAATLYMIADLKEKINNIERGMKEKAKSRFRDPLIEQKKEEIDFSHLHQVLNKQAAQIKKLEGDIQMTKRTFRSEFP